jgi:hypothetical protein
MSNKELRLKPLFDAMDKAGGTKQPDFKTLTFKEKFKIGFSIWAFLFSIFYYLYHGMWKKGMTAGIFLNKHLLSSRYFRVVSEWS